MDADHAAKETGTTHSTDYGAVDCLNSPGVVRVPPDLMAEHRNRQQYQDVAGILNASNLTCEYMLPKLTASKNKGPGRDPNHRLERKGLANSVHWHEIILQNRDDAAPCRFGSRAIAHVRVDPVPDTSEVFVFRVLRTGLPHDDRQGSAQRSVSH